jgi:hypothetical protein
MNCSGNAVACLAQVSHRSDTALSSRASSIVEVHARNRMLATGGSQRDVPDLFHVTLLT